MHSTLETAEASRIHNSFIQLCCLQYLIKLNKDYHLWAVHPWTCPDLGKLYPLISMDLSMLSSVYNQAVTDDKLLQPWFPGANKMYLSTQAYERHWSLWQMERLTNSKQLLLCWMTHKEGRERLLVIRWQLWESKWLLATEPRLIKRPVVPSQ